MNYIDKNILEKIGYYYVIDKLSILCPYGRDIIYNLKPIKEKQKLMSEYKNIQRCFSIINNSKLINDFENLFRRFRDIRNTFIRCRDKQILDEVELYEIKCFVKLSIELKELCEKSNLQIQGIILYDFSNIYELLNPLRSKESYFYIYDEYSLKLKEIRRKKKEFDNIIFKEKDIEKQKKLFEKRQQIINEEKAEILEIRKALSLYISKYVDKLIEETLSIGKMDVVFAKAKLALNYNMCCPKISSEIKIKMNMGINPMVKADVEKRGGKFSPISIEVSKGTCVITGANMGGKTVVLSTITLNYIMASMGFYVFAEAFEFGSLDFIYFLWEDYQSLENGLSTFGGEVFKLKKILEKIKNENGLIILDEFARGTNPIEGSNITKALISYLNKFDSISILSTHYDDVCYFAKLHYQVRGLKHIDFKLLKKATKQEEYLKLINDYMDYTLEKVDKNTPIPRDAINICLLIGIDEEIINIAKTLYDQEVET